MKKRPKLTVIALTFCFALLGLSLLKIGSINNSSVAASTATATGAGICGVVLSHTPATGNTNGSINIAGITYVIARGTSITGVIVGQNRCYRLCFNAEGQITGGNSDAGYPVPLVCGIVTSFSRSIGGVAGSVTIGGAKIRLAQGLYLTGQDQVAPGSNTCLIPFVAGEQAGAGSYFVQSSSPKQVRIPTTVHGTTFGSAPQDDIFNLPDPTILTLNNDQAVVFPVGPQTFGKTLSPESPKIQGFSYSTPNSTLQALSCTESFWDIVMDIASNGVTSGDTVTVNLLDSNKAIARQVAVFAIQNGGAQVTNLHPDVVLLSAGGNTKGVGHFAPFLVSAGASGARTSTLALVFSTSSPAFMGCFQLAVEIKRGSNIGTTTVVIENVVVKRMERPQDRATSIGLGLQTNTIGWYPTGRVCDFVCWPCTLTTPPENGWISGFVYCDGNDNGIKEAGEAGIPDVTIKLLYNSGAPVIGADGNPIVTRTDGNGYYFFDAPPGTYKVMEVQPAGSPVTGDGKDTAGNCGGAVTNDMISDITVQSGIVCGNYNFGELCGVIPKCDTICWRATQFFINNIRHLPGGTVLISGVNANNPVGIQQGLTSVRLALQGGSSPMQRLNKEYVTAQLSLAYSGGSGSPVVFNTFWSALSCSGISFAPVTLSNGVTLSSNSLLDTLVNQTNLAIRENRLNDMGALADIWALLNGRCG